MKNPNIHLPRYFTACLVVIGMISALSCTAQAASMTWASATTGGTWSTAGNWLPGTAAPTTGDTALLANATASRIVNYDASASGALGTLNFNQTSAFTNQLTLLRNLTVTNAITLGASGGGTAMLSVGDLSLASGGVNLTASGGINVNSGGFLLLKSSGATNNITPTVTGNVTIGGGTLQVSGSTSAGTSAPIVTGVVAMTSGSLTLSDPGSTSGIRFNAGSFNLTGGTVTSGQPSNYLWVTGNNATNTVGSGVTVVGSGANLLSVMIAGTGNTWNVDNTGLGQFVFRNLNNVANMTNTLKTSVVGGTASVYSIGFGQSTTGYSSKLVLGSNVTTAVTGNNQVISETNGSGAGGNDSYILDLNGYTLSGTSATAVWKPNTLTTGAGTTTWAFNSTAAGGVLQVQQVDLSAANVITNIGSGVTLQATGGNSSTITLSGSGTIDAGSTLLYSGAAATGTPAALTSNRTIGNLNVSSGALKVSASSITAAGLLTVGSGATLDMSLFGLTANGLTFNNGNLTTPANLTVTGTGAVLKTGASTLTLSGANTYTGNTTINGGILNLGVAENANVSGPMGKQLANAAGTVLMTGGTLQYSASNVNDYSGRFSTAGSQAWGIDTNSQNVTFATALQGAGSSLTKSGAGTLTVAAGNTYTGTTQIASGTLSASNIVVSGGSSSLGNATSAVVLGDATNKGMLSYTGNSATYTRGFTVNAGGGGFDVTTAGQTLTISTGDITGTGSVILGGSATAATAGIIVNSNISTSVKQYAGALTLSGVLSGAATSLSYGNISNSGTVTLTNANNSFAGGVNGFSGFAHLVANATTVLANTGSNSALGAGGTFTLNNRSLTLTGFTAAQSTDRAWNVGNTNAALNNSGSNTITLTGAITNNITVGTLSLGGTYTAGTNVISGAISNGSGVLGITTTAGKWLLSGSNTFTGNLAANGGLLQFGNTAALYSGTTTNWTATKIKVANGGTLALNVGALTNEFTTGNVTTLLTNLGGANGTSSAGFAAGAAIGFDTTNANGGTFTVSDTLANSTGVGGGALGVSKLGANTLVLGNAANTYSGKTIVQNGTLSFATGATTATANQSLGTNAAVDLGEANISAGTLQYIGTTGTLAKNINALGTGINTISNTGTGLLTLSGTLTKAGTVLGLNGGANGITVSGLISGSTASPNSDLYITGGLVTLNSANSYYGPTNVYNSGTLALGISNAIPSNSTLTLGDATTAGVFNMGSYTNAIGSLAFGAGGGTVMMAASGTSAAQLSAAGTVALGSANTLDLSGMGTTAGLYKLISGSSLSGTFGAVSNLNGLYTLKYSGTALNAQHKATISLASGTNAANVHVGSQTVNFTIGNSAPSQSADLNYTLTGLSGSGTRVASAGSSAGTGTYTASAGVNSFNIVANDSNASNTGQSVAFSQTGYRYAAVNALSDVSLGNFHVGKSANTTSVSATNTAVSTDIYSEKLDLSGSTTGAATFGGGASLIAAGSSTSLTIGVTDTAGAHTGTVVLSATSDGNGTSNLGLSTVGSQTINVTGTGYRFASANTLGDVSFGKFLTGTTLSTVLSATNTATNDAYSEKLTVSGSATGAASFSGSATVVAGSSTSLTVGLANTVGVHTGTVAVNLVSDGAGTSGLGTTALTGQTVNVSGTGYDRASLSQAQSTSGNTTTINLGNASGAYRAGATVSEVNLTQAQAGFSTSSFSATTIASGTSAAVAQFDSSNKLNGTYKGTLGYTAQNDASILGSGTGDLNGSIGLSVNVSSKTDSGAAQILAGGSYKDYGIDTSAALSATTGHTTTATILGGTNTTVAAVNLTMTLSNAALIKSSKYLSSNAVDISGINGTMFVLQMNYDTNSSVGTDPYYIGWYDTALGGWVNAIGGNSNSTHTGIDLLGSNAIVRAYNASTDYQLGLYGFDSKTNTAWAVVDHNSEFAVIPEPSTWAMLVGGLGMLAFGQKLRRRSRI